MMLAVLLGLLGAAMGSFAALLAERLVRGEGFVSGGSRCRCCGTALGAAELVPLLSFPLLGDAVAIVRRRSRRCCGRPKSSAC